MTLTLDGCTFNVYVIIDCKKATIAHCDFNGNISDTITDVTDCSFGWQG